MGGWFNREGGAAAVTVTASARVFVGAPWARRAGTNLKPEKARGGPVRAGGAKRERVGSIDGAMGWRSSERLTDVCVCARACVGSGVGDAKRRKRADGVGRREDGRGD